ncbi:MAG: DUF2158 domain-containing protein [Stenotrophomonas sp.]|nr:MAG: DUF2158 domain-containing protein [Stenotrophomonas sp.]
MEFKPGDVVVLRSGGPKMTVSSLEGSRVWCVWFDAAGVPQSKVFERAILKDYD